ncbi:TerB family tellurite resistance protein [Bradyrhizobium sp. SZCCHNR3118]|uniref:TerB family tellurite resistance protein n=1 Tax=Bradyrhizobium sp. SZCCHNR3118 TaxID=3057468 RepID=UPI0029168EA5|nr:TerB family tellurite resistance protein [Bradyrhizobium sp. SZCCHNR3118]
MSLLKKFFANAEKAINKYTGDGEFLAGVAAAAANVTAADGKIEDSEKEAAISGMLANPTVSGSFGPSEIEQALKDALIRAGTMSGRMMNKRAIQALITRSPEARQDVFLIAADVANDGGIGAEERKVLADIAKALNLDGEALLAA